MTSSPGQDAAGRSFSGSLANSVAGGTDGHGQLVVWDRAAGPKVFHPEQPA